MCQVCGVALNNEPIPPAGHRPSESFTVITAPTCTLEGEQAQLCQVCGMELNNEPIPKAYHSMGQWIPDDLWCTQERSETRFCEQCLSYSESRRIPANASHDVQKTTLQEPSCTETGLQQLCCSRCGWSETEEIPATGHVLTSEIITAATCRTSGTVRTYCTNEGCGYSFIMTIEKLDHNYDIPTLIPGEDCEANDIEITLCRDCGYERIRELPAAGHDYSDWSIVSCEIGGVSRRVCRRCPAAQERIVLPGSHVWGDEMLINLPTCTSPGKAVQECTLCDALNERIIEELDHVYDLPVITVPPLCETNGLASETCGLCGYTRTTILSASGHRWNEWESSALTSCLIDGSRSRSCADCDAVQSKPVVSHSFSDWAIFLPASCTEDGQLIRTCPVCNAEEMQIIPKLPHSYGIEEVTVINSCSRPGSAVSRCLDCGAEHIRILDQLPHTLSEWETIKPAGCIEDGVRMRTCRDCSFTEEQSIIALGHQYIENVVNPGCGQVKILRSVCKTCGHTHVTELGIQEHQFSGWAAEQNPACGKDGVEARSCSSCGLIEKRTLPALQHIYGTWNILTQTSCSEPGRKSASCMLCGMETEEQIPVSEHTYTPWHRTVADDCLKECKIARQCSVCGAREEKAIPPRNHVYETWQIIKPATCTQTGLRTRECRYCNAAETQELPLRKHITGPWSVSRAATLFHFGEQIRSCKNCGQTLQSRRYYPGDKAFAVSFCVYGPQFRDIWPGVSDEWYRFARIDLTQEGQATFPLIADNKYQVGEVTATVMNGMVKIDYRLFGKRTEVFKERMQLLIPGLTITPETLSSNLQGRKISRNISISRSLKNATSALLFLRFDGIFDPDDPDLLPLSEHEETTGTIEYGPDAFRRMEEFTAEGYRFVLQDPTDSTVK